VWGELEPVKVEVKSICCFVILNGFGKGWRKRGGRRRGRVRRESGWCKVGEGTRMVWEVRWRAVRSRREVRADWLGGWRSGGCG
jgi:hypothetical protein